MFQRILNPSLTNSFFLFGARGTGKSTFVKEKYLTPNGLYVNLLLDDAFDRYSQRPTLLLEEIEALPKQPDVVIIDEVQRVPRLLDLVHHQIETKRQRFILTGSSARKLKRGGANLLAGRAFNYHLFPLCVSELGGEFDLSQALQWGTLPNLFSLTGDTDKRDYLTAYARTYLKEEVWQEQLVRDLVPFRRFLELAAQMNGKLLNFSRIADDVGVDSKTIRKYYEILVDTHLGFFLEPWSRSFRKRQRQAPKFYLFDTGVTRALSGTLSVALTPSTSTYGYAFEQFILCELYRLNDYLRKDFRFSFLITHAGVEVDLILETPRNETIFVEIKSSSSVDSREIERLNTVASEAKVDRALIICQEKVARKIDGVLVIPWRQALEELMKD